MMCLFGFFSMGESILVNRRSFLENFTTVLLDECLLLGGMMVVWGWGLSGVESTESILLLVWWI